METKRIGTFEMIPSAEGWQPPNGHRVNYCLRSTPQRIHRPPILPVKKRVTRPLSTTGILRKLGYYSTSKMGIGIGMFSKVYKATKDGEHFAIKVMNLKGLRKGYADKFLARELKCLSGLSHPNICQMFGHEQYLEELKIIVLEYCQHGDLLNRLIKDGPLSNQVGKSWMSQLMDALVYIHSQDIAHRDIKAENVLIYGENQIKLSDFGFACQKVVDPFSQTFCGSVSYCSPQILSGKKYDVFKTDVWSMGILIYISMTGKMPFIDESNKPKMLQQINNSAYVFPEDTSQECRACILTLLTADETARPTANIGRCLPFFN